MRVLNVTKHSSQMRDHIANYVHTTTSLKQPNYADTEMEHTDAPFDHRWQDDLGCGEDPARESSPAPELPQAPLADQVFVGAGSSIFPQFLKTDFYRRFAK